MDLIYPVGGPWPSGSLVWGDDAGHGESVEQYSPVDGSLIQHGRLLDPAEMLRLLAPRPLLAPLSDAELWAFCTRLIEVLRSISVPLLETIQLETGFTLSDSRELIDGALEYLAGCQGQIEGAVRQPAPVQEYQVGLTPRNLRVIRRPWGTVAVILPQNAMLLVGITCLVNALASGNRVILRAPLQSSRSSLVLAAAINRAGPPTDRVSVVLARAKEFMGALYQCPSPILIHYMGSSRHAPEVISEAFRHGKSGIIDGSGNCWVFVDADVPAETAADILTAGALRYNGQTCTSINGAVIHPSIYPEVRRHLVRRWSALTAGAPLQDNVDIGPLFDEAQAAWCLEQLLGSGGKTLCGGTRVKNLLMPTLVEAPAQESALVSEGLFGAGLWIMPGDREMFLNWWPYNRYPLGAGVLSPSVDADWWLSRLPNLARLNLNGDPSIEYIFEPWGGYPGSGMNPVGTWLEKYQRAVVVDEPEQES